MSRPAEIIRVTYSKKDGVSCYVNVLSLDLEKGATRTYTDMYGKKYMQTYHIVDPAEIKRLNDQIAAIREYDVQRRAELMAEVMYRPGGSGAMQAEDHFGGLLDDT